MCLLDIIIVNIITLFVGYYHRKHNHTLFVGYNHRKHNHTMFIGYRSNILDPLIHDLPSSVPPTTEHDEQAGDTNDGRQHPQNDPHNGGNAQVQQPTQLVLFVAVVSTIIVLVTDETHGDTATVSALELIGVARTYRINRIEGSCFIL